MQNGIIADIELYRNRQRAADGYSNNEDIQQLPFRVFSMTVQETATNPTNAQATAKLDQSCN